MRELTVRLKNLVHSSDDARLVANFRLTFEIASRLIGYFVTKAIALIIVLNRRTIKLRK